jgi:hypothetical protein
MSITCLIVLTVLFYVFTVSTASSARSRERDIFVWLFATGPTGVLLSMGGSPGRNRRAVTIVDCMGSPLAWTLGSTSSLSATGWSTLVVAGFGMLTAAVMGEFGFIDTVIVKYGEAGSEACPA